MEVRGGVILDYKSPLPIFLPSLPFELTRDKEEDEEKGEKQVGSRDDQIGKTADRVMYAQPRKGRGGGMSTVQGDSSTCL